MMAETHTGPGGYKITKLDKKDRAKPSYNMPTPDTATGKAKPYQSRGMVPWDSTGRANVNNGFAWDPARGRYMSTADYQNTIPPTPTPPPPLPSPTGGGNGSSGGFTAQQLAQQAALRQLIGSSLLKPMDVNPAFDADIAAAKQAYAGVAGGVSKADPYLGLVGMQAPQVRPEMEQFLQAQGVGTGDYGNAVDYANAQLAAGAQNWSGLAQALGQNHLAAQQGVVDVANLQGQNVVQGFEAQRAATQAALAEQAKKQKLDLILQLIAAGGDVKGLI